VPCFNSHFPLKSQVRLKCDGIHAETRFSLSAKWTNPFKSAGASVQSTTGSRGLRISSSNGSNAGYTTFQGSVKGTGYPLHSPVSPSLPLPCVTVYHHISTRVFHHFYRLKILLSYPKVQSCILYCSQIKKDRFLRRNAASLH